jgi:glucokinase
MTEEIKLLLAGDLGGTKTSLAVFSPEAGLRAPLLEGRLPSGRYPSLEALVKDFFKQMQDAGLDPQALDRACFGVAGPVVNGQATITNLPWRISEQQLTGTLGLASVTLINDLAAISQGVPQLAEADYHVLNEGQPAPHGTIAVVAPGTGLGEGFLVWAGTRYRSFPSEGGHVDFAPVNDEQLELRRYLQQRFRHISYERVCSGLGLPNIYAYFKDNGYADEPAWLAEQLAGAGDKTPIIMQAALAEDGPALCRATLDMFVSILGAEAGNMALKVMASGGVYLGGGIPPRILPALEQAHFLEAFRSKGRFAEMLGRVPVKVILNPKAALLGAATYGFEL